MSDFIDIRADISEVMSELNGFSKETRSISTNLMREAARKTTRKIKNSYSTYLNKRSGNLYKSIRYYTLRNKIGSTVIARKKGDTSFAYGFALAKGYTIEPKNSDLLTFKIGDKWIRTYGPITVNSRNFMEEPANRYLKSPELDSDLEAKLVKEVERIEKKYAKKGSTT